MVEYDNKRSNTITTGNWSAEGIHYLWVMIGACIFRSPGLLVSLVLLCCRADAQQTALPYKLYTIRDGLANQQVRAFMEDSRGYVWIGTNGGLSRFDGHIIESYLPREGFSGKPVYPPILEAPDGSLWYRCIDAVYRFDGITETALPMTPEFWETVDPVMWPLIDTHVRTLLGARFPVLNQLSEKNLTLRDFSGGCVVIDFVNFCYHRFNRGRFTGTGFLPDNFSADFLPESTFRYLLSKKYEYYAFASDSISRVAAYDYSADSPTALHPLAPRDFHFNSKRGASFWIRRGDRYQLLTPGDFNRVDKGFYDSKGRVFIATDQGMAVFYPDGPQLVSAELARYPWSVIPDNRGMIWIGSYLDGFVQMDLKNATSRLVRLPSGNVNEHQVFPGKQTGAGGELIFGGYRGLYILQNGKPDFLDLGESVEAVAFDAVTNCYYAAGVNILVIDKDLKKKTGEIPVPTTVNDGVGLSSVKLSGGDLLASGKRGIVRLHPNGLVRKIYSLEFPCICLETDANGALWAGTGNGIFRYDSIRDTFFRAIQEVVDGAVNSLVALPENRLAVVTDLELIVLDIAVPESPGLLGFWNEANGFQLLGASDNGSCFDGSYLWVPAGTGVQRIAIGNLNNLAIFESRLRTDKINGSRVAVTDTFPVVKIYSDALDVDLSLINPVAGAYTVEYRCNGGIWIKTADLKNIHISGLLHGSNYLQFRVKAPGLPEHKWPVTALSAEASLPLAQRGVFKILLLFVLMALVLSVLAWHRRRQREKVLLNQLDQTRLGTVQAQLNPHILFNLLSSLQNSVVNRSREEASDHLVRISRLIRDTLEISISSSENAKAPFPVISVGKEADFLRNYLGLEAMQQNPPFSFDVKIGLTTSPDLVSIPPLLVQPLAENAVIHGVRPVMNKCCSIEVVFREEGGNIIVSVTDDGVGIANSVRSGTLRYRSRGSELLEKRLHLLGKLGYPASVSVRQRETGGTIAEITIKKIVCESFL